jgi:hypothetical protein
MGNYQVVFRFRLGNGVDRETFAQFVEEKYLPAMLDGPTRAGMVTEAVLLNGAVGEENGEYWLHARFDGLEPQLHWVLPRENSEAAERLAQMGVQAEHVGTHRILASRQSDF